MKNINKGGRGKRFALKKKKKRLECFGVRAFALFACEISKRYKHDRGCFCLQCKLQGRKPRPSLCVCLCVCLSLASDPSETIKVIIIKLGTVTASGMIMHRVLIILTLTFIQGHTDIILNVRLFQKVFKQWPASLL